ncbi:MAG: hypothetical protein ACT4NY_34315 [Pseudonocardiales bacterium]
MRTVTGWSAEYVPVNGGSATRRNGYSMTADDDAALAALRESIELALEVEGPPGQ